MTKILFLDDDQIRHKGHQDLTNNRVCETTYVFTATEAIEALKEGEFDLICLDHDLGGEYMASSASSYSGMEVVRWVVENKSHPKAAFLIHSLNPVGARYMCDVLSDNDYTTIRAPFLQSNYCTHIKMWTFPAK